MSVTQSIPRRRPRRVAIGAALAVGVATTATALATSAHADAPSAILRLHAAGSSYSGPGTFASGVVAAGTATTYVVLVMNNGTTASQYKLRVNPLINENSIASYTVLAGSPNVTAQATDPDGYYTPLIAPGKTLTLTIKVTPPKTATANDEYFTNVTVSDLHNSLLDSVLVETVVKATTGSGADMFVTGAGQQTAIATGGFVNVSDPALNLGGTASYSVKLLNSGNSSNSFTVHMVDGSDCSSHFLATVKVGSVNVTAGVLAGTYTTPVLLTTKSVTLTVTVKYLSSFADCDYPFDVNQLVATPAFGAAETANLITSPAITAPAQGVGFGGPDLVMITPVATNDNPYTPSCDAFVPCDSLLLLSDDGSATAQLTADASASNGSQNLFFRPSSLPCTEAGGGAMLNAYISTTDNASQIVYDSYGQSADAAYAAGGSDFTDHLCYAASQPFYGYYPSNGHWTGSYAHDANTTGTVPLDPSTGEYVGLLPACDVTGDVPPCLAGPGFYNVFSSRHFYEATINTAPGDSAEVSS